jgi:hypothetical protein
MKWTQALSEFRRNGGLRPVNASEPDELFITCASFEPRCVAVTESMLGNYSATRGIAYVNQEFQKVGRTSDHERIIATNLSLTCEAFQGTTLGTWEDAAKQFTVLRSALAPQGVQRSIRRITLDITTFNREALLAVLTILRWAYPQGVLRLAYVSPEEYNPVGRSVLAREGIGEKPGNEEEAAKIAQYLWLSRGFRKMRNAIGFPGIQRPQRPAMLILLPGFEVERALTVVDNLEPSIVLIGKPSDATRDIFYERSLEAKAQMLRLFQGRQPVHEFEFSCNNVEQTLGALLGLFAKYLSVYNVFVSVMSTKPAAVAAFLAAEQFPEVQITCSVPGEYNVDDYSGGMHEIGFFEMPERSQMKS